MFVAHRRFVRATSASRDPWLCAACYGLSVNDTSPAAAARYHELLRAMPPECRLEAAMRLSRGVRALALAGIRELFPDADEQELKVRLTVRLYGREVAARLFDSVPADAR